MEGPFVADVIVLVGILSVMVLLQVMTVRWSGIALWDIDPCSIPPRNY
ncbi:MAG: hypothetical protein LC797_08070 [Chloroflexi bacterium]|nr:hypothetical protein [Chloroflexota bacterium]